MTRPVGIILKFTLALAVGTTIAYQPDSHKQYTGAVLQRLGSVSLSGLLVMA